MAKVVVTLKIMPDDVSADLNQISSSALQLVKDYGADQTKHDIEPIAFGLKAVKILFVMEESKGSTDELEKSISSLPGVGSVEVTDVRRTIG